MQSSEYKFGILSQTTHWIYIIIRVIWERIAWGGPLNDDSRVSGCVEEWGEDVGLYEGVGAGV